VCSSIFTAEFREDVRTTIPTIVENLKDGNSYIHDAAIELLSKLAAQGVCVSVTFLWVYSSMFVAEFREDVRAIIPAIAEHLKDSVFHVRKAAIKGLTRLAMRGMCSHHFLVGVLSHACS